MLGMVCGKSIMAVLKVFYLFIPSSIELSTSMLSNSTFNWTTWQCVDDPDGCPSICTARPAGACIFTSGVTAKCFCQFSGDKSRVFQWIVTALVLTSSFLLMVYT